MFIRILLVFGFCIGGVLEAQNNLVILSEKGDAFWLYVNELKINDSVQSIVKATAIYEDTCHVKVVYVDKKLSDFNGRVYLLQNGKSCKNIDFTYSVETVKKKKELRFISTNYTVSDISSPVEKPGEHIKKTLTLLQKQKDDSNRLAERYPTPVPCKNKTQDTLVTLQIKILKDNHIAFNRVKDAKWFISHACLSVSQAQKLLAVFDREDDKLEVAEFAYTYLYDSDNFIQLKQAFERSYQQEELNTFYQKKTSK